MWGLILSWLKTPQWSFAKSLLGGPVARGAFLIPLVGYSLLFSDYVSKLWEFQAFLEASHLHYSVWRPRCVYFGLVLLSAAQVPYWLLSHRIVRRYNHLSEFISAEHDLYFNLNYGKENNRFVDGLYKLETHFNIEHVRHDGGSLRTQAFQHVYNAAQRHRPIAIRITVVLALAGYGLLAIPSADLFLRVLQSVFLTPPN
ncbi:MAG TPA: hypothetical protein PK417_04410 [Hyphomonas sp.]|nr:hypothetical protein [Hyphomonas sp.]HRX74549.1 hypothetical protein [Hyphomonas sp.]